MDEEELFGDRSRRGISEEVCNSELKKMLASAHSNGLSRLLGPLQTTTYSAQSPLHFPLCLLLFMASLLGIHLIFYLEHA